MNIAKTTVNLKWLTKTSKEGNNQQNLGPEDLDLFAQQTLGVILAAAYKFVVH